MATFAAPAMAQPYPGYPGNAYPGSAYPTTATHRFPGETNRYKDPLGAPRNVCFSAASLHRWCRVFVSSAAGTCVCGVNGGGNLFSGTLVTDAQLYELIGEDVKQAEVGVNGRRMATSRSRAHNGY